MEISPDTPNGYDRWRTCVYDAARVRRTRVLRIGDLRVLLVVEFGLVRGGRGQVHCNFSILYCIAMGISPLKRRLNGHRVRSGLDVGVTA